MADYKLKADGTATLDVPMGNKINQILKETMNDKTQNDVLADLQAKPDGLPAGAVFVPPATCEVCGTGPCNAVNPNCGVCPRCHKTDGYLNNGNDHWFLCHEHKNKWVVGANLFSSSMEECCMCLGRPRRPGVLRGLRSRFRRLLY